MESPASDMSASFSMAPPAPAEEQKKKKSKILVPTNNARNTHQTASSAASAPADEPMMSWDSIRDIYEEKWLEKKREFHASLKQNCQSLVKQFKTGKQEVYALTHTPHDDRYIKAFRQLFHDSGFQATVEQPTKDSNASSKKMVRMYITLPDCCV